MKRTLEHAWRGWSENGGIYGNIWGIYIYIIINLIIYIYMDLLMFREKTIVNQLFLGTLPTQKPWHKDWWSPK
jgi:hypothetical protein